MNTHEKGHTLVILGAGATVGSGFKLRDGTEIPYDKNFFETAKKWLETDLFEYRTEQGAAILYKSFDYMWKKYGSNDIGLEEMWNTIVIHTKFVEKNAIHFGVDNYFKVKGMSNSPSVKIVRWADFYMRILIQKVFAEELDYKQNIGRNYDSFKRLFEVLSLKETDKKVSFVSFNYDLCLENKLKEAGISFFYPNFTDDMGTNGVPIFKPHGSLNWWHGYDGFVRLKEDWCQPIMIKENSYHLENSPRSFSKYQPAIIPLDILKEELFNEVGQQRLHDHFMRISMEVGKAVERADKIIIIGYSFPSADAHVRWLMRAGTRGMFSKGSDKNTRSEKKVFVVTNNDDGKENLHKTIKGLFCSMPETFAQGFENCFDGLKGWLQNS